MVQGFEEFPHESTIDVEVILIGRLSDEVNIPEKELLIMNKGLQGLKLVDER